MLYPKERIIRSEAYLRAVASLPCWRCGLAGFSQACHGDAGKGMAMKACDLTAWPGCGPRQNEPGCHYLIGSTGRLTRDMRRSIEKQAAKDTQALLKKMAEHDRKLRATLEKVGLL